MPLHDVTLDLCAEAVIEEIEKLPDERINLVGHSLAGMVLPRVADRVPERLQRLVHITHGFLKEQEWEHAGATRRWHFAS